MSLFTGSLLLDGAAAPGGLSTNYKISKNDDDMIESDILHFLPTKTPSSLSSPEQALIRIIFGFPLSRTQFSLFKGLKRHF